MENRKIIGTCEKCSGPVSVPNAWYGIKPPVPSCEKCNSKMKQVHGPIVEMK